MAKKPTKPVKKPAAKFNTYSNLSKKSKSKRATKKDVRSRKKAEYLATLPKNPFKRFLYRLHPKRFFKYWFSRDGLKMMAKLAGAFVLLLAIMVGALFAYYRKDLHSMSPEELAKRVQTTVSRYYDRNGVLLWEDKGVGDYRLVVESDQISQYMKDATVAIEDKDFYKHGGVSASGIARAVINNASGSGGAQGGSTLTQQLIKQVYFSDESQERGIKGIPRKIKEAILSIEAERIYTKDQLLTLYLNESPYGGRRNGVESAAQTYFGKNAKDLTLAESALLASIPQAPGLYNPYNTDGNKALLQRQQTTLDYMADQGYITYKQADAAKAEPILDTLKPLEDQTSDARAPHFVNMVKAQLEGELGTKVVGQGGLTITTTLDIRVQDIIDSQVDQLFESNTPTRYGFDNAAMTMIDSQTGQILGLRGSRSYTYPGYGAVNAADSFIQPGSTIKPEVWAALINKQDGTTYGAGSILSDQPLAQSIYQTGNGQSVRNADGRFKGNVTIRQSLGESRNIPVIKALVETGRDQTIDVIRNLGDISYCTDGADATVGPAAAIGGCGAKQIEHANAFASFARMGTYKPVATVLEVKNSQNQVLKIWADDENNKQAVDPQTAYIISDILSDDSARVAVFGRNQPGMVVNGVKTATKTGTSDLGGDAKDLWMMSYSPKATLSVWYGNHVPATLNAGATSLVPGPIVNAVMHDTHYNVFQPDGTWSQGDWFQKPSGIQTLTVNGKTDIFPSWYNKNKASTTTEKMIFDTISKKKATDCTPDAARIEVEVTRNVDPVTKQTTYSAPDGYDPSADDDIHKCDDIKPFVAGITSTSLGGGKYRITATITGGTHALDSVIFSVGGNTYSASASGNDYSIVIEGLTGDQAVSVTATDRALYNGAGSQTLTFGTTAPPDPANP